MKVLACLLVAASLAAGAPACLARTHTVRPYQSLPDPGPGYANFGLQVSIDGDSIIALADRADGRSALLYRRGANGVWALSQVLLAVTAPPEALRANLAMRNGIAAVQIDATLHVFQLRAGSWVESQVAAEARTPAGTLAISAQRIAVGTDACRDDTLLLAETTTGSWTVTGRAVGPPAACTIHSERDLNNSHLFVRTGDNQVHVYVRSLTEEWTRVGSFSLPEDAADTPGPVALQNEVAVSPGSFVFRGSYSVWSPAGRLTPVDRANNAGFATQVVFRDGVAITRESWGEMHDPDKPYVYVDSVTAFDHVAILQTYGFTDDYDVSGRTVVASSDVFGERDVSVFTLPSPILAPRALARDFENHDASDWAQPYGHTFEVMARGSNDVFHYFGSDAETRAILAGTDWTNYQSLEADFTPTEIVASTRDRYAGLAVRWIDERNTYLLKWTHTGALQIVRRYQGADTVLAQATVPMALNQRHRLRLAVDRSFLSAWVDGAQRITANDARHKHGSVALLSYRVRGDYDNVYVAPTAPLNLAWKNYRETFDWGQPFTFTRGHWELTGDTDPDGLSQTTTDTSAYALVGSDTDEQAVTSRLRLDTFNTAGGPVAWVGLFARYADASNYYQVSLRSSNQLQIRKVVNGQLTVLAAVPFTTMPGRFYDLQFAVLGDQLHAYVNGALVAQAIDGALPRGHYGLGTYRSAATFQTFIVDQP